MKPTAKMLEYVKSYRWMFYYYSLYAGKLNCGKCWKNSDRMQLGSLGFSPRQSLPVTRRAVNSAPPLNTSLLKHLQNCSMCVSKPPAHSSGRAVMNSLNELSGRRAILQFRGTLSAARRWVSCYQKSKTKVKLTWCQICGGEMECHCEANILTGPRLRWQRKLKCILRTLRPEQ